MAGRPPKLTLEQQTAVRQQLEDPNCKIKDLAVAYGVDRATIRRYLPPSRRRQRVAKLDLVGRAFGEWTVIAKADRPAAVDDHHTYWECWCRCGVIAVVRGGSLISGTSKQCLTCYRARNRP